MADEKKLLLDNRDLSWIKFNSRVLEEAEDASVPLLERLNFLSIYCSNTDEFCKVRIGKLHHAVLNDVKGKAYDKQNNAGNVLDKVYKEAQRAQLRADKDFREVMTLLGEGECPVRHLKPEELTEADKAFLRDYFREALSPILEPMFLDRRQPFPLYGCKDIIAGCIITKKKTARSVGLVRVPSDAERVVFLPSDKGLRYMLCEEVVLLFLPVIFGEWQIESSGLFAMLENADISENASLYPCEDSPRVVMEKILARRDLQAPAVVKLCGSDSDLLGIWLQKALYLDDGRLAKREMPLNIKYIGSLKDRLPAERVAALTYPKQPPTVPAWAEGSLIDKALEQDRLLVYPYNDVEVFVRFVEEVASSPRVKAVSITLYRVAKQSRIAEALMAAAKAGKQVTVMVELRARFDEANNIYWAKRLEEAGCRVLYGVPEYKVHSKVLLIELGGEEEGKYIMQFGTGNYNEVTSRIYTDCSLLTSDPELAEDALAFFESLDRQKFMDRSRALLVAPVIMKRSLMKLVYDETEKAKKGQPARIWLKMNSISDKELITRLIDASRAGVDVRLCVRGIACLLPGANGDDIELRSIVGRYLEHARIYVFGADSSAAVYISSADFMSRNTEKRIEVAAPVRDPVLKEKVVRLMELTFADNVKARILQADGKYTRRPPEGARIVSQDELFGL
ncbi:MAG: polyphosphate kinase 1 [Abditibacteriota bacterium]|nr:polyphosphate kinase 1 [Abditibacteriota bacterium]